MDQIIIFGAKYLFLAAVAITLVAWAQTSHNKKVKFAATVAVAGIIAITLAKLASRLYYDPRPFVESHIKPLVNHAADNGFPSEHTVFTVTLGMVTYLYSRKLGIAALLIAMIVGISRIAADVHSPIDIIGGILIGMSAGAGAYWLVENYLSKTKSTRR